MVVAAWVVVSMFSIGDSFLHSVSSQISVAVGNTSCAAAMNVLRTSSPEPGLLSGANECSVVAITLPF